MADRPRQAGHGDLPGPDVAYARWTDACAQAGWHPRASTERVTTADGLGRVTAAAVRARWPAPRFDCAAMDGIAIQATSAGPASEARMASAANRTGPHDRWRLAPSAFVRVGTGDPMPPGTDTVVERERVEHDADGSAWISGSAPRGQHVRVEGEDFRAGQCLIPAGHRLRPVDLAAAAAGGYAELDVVRPPAVAIIPTGDEIRPAGSALGPGDITDSNSIMLAAQAVAAGARPLVCDVQPDDPAAIAAQLRRAALAADLVLVIAGSSGGHRDHTAAVLAKAGGLAVRGVAVRPGHPVLLGYVRPDPAGTGPAGTPRTVPVIGVPGYPLAAAVIFELFAAPLLAALQGTPAPDRARQRVQLACDWMSSPDVEDWVPVLLAPPPADQPAPGDTLATPSRRGAGAITRLLRADAWWPIPIGQAKFARGEYIDVQPIPGGPAR